MEVNAQRHFLKTRVNHAQRNVLSSGCGCGGGKGLLGRRRSRPALEEVRTVLANYLVFPWCTLLTYTPKPGGSRRHCGTTPASAVAWALQVLSRMWPLASGAQCPAPWDWLAAGESAGAVPLAARGVIKSSLSHRSPPSCPSPQTAGELGASLFPLASEASELQVPIAASGREALWPSPVPPGFSLGPGPPLRPRQGQQGVTGPGC